MAEGRVAYLGAAKDAVPFFNQYVVGNWIHIVTMCFELSFYHGCNTPVSFSWSAISAWSLFFCRWMLSFWRCIW